ncbi:MAG: DUF4062 domain-containing protein [Pseudomonadota bacterium]
MPTDPKTQVFVSSTSDLVHERRAVKDALPDRSVGVYLYEDDVAQSEPPRKVLARELRKSEVFVALLGPRYGSTTESEHGETSIVEWEFKTALSQPGTAIFTFTNVDDPADAEPRQREFITQALDFDSIWGKRFSSIDELKSHVAKAFIYYQSKLLKRLGERLIGEKQQGERDRSGQPKRLTRTRRWIAVGASLSIIGIALGTLNNFLTLEHALVALCIVTAASIAAIVLNDY